MRRTAIAASNQLAADAGAHVASLGGNAVDAAIAASMVSMTTEPGIIAPGASAFVTVWPPAGDPVVIDGYAEMPGREHPDPPEGFGDRVHMQYGGGMETLVGPAAVATPGVYRAYGRAVEKYSNMGWEAVLDPAIRVAEDGFPLTSVSRAYLAYAQEPIFDRDPDGRRALRHDDGSPLEEGEAVHLPGLADAYRTLAAEGPESFYTGSLGRRLAEMMAQTGGRITAADLAAYEAVERQPIVVEMGPWQVATNPAPAIGGATMAAMLLLLGDERMTGWSGEGIATMARAQQAVLSYRGHHLDGATDTEGAVAELLDAAAVADYARMLGSPSTVHTSAVDTEGRACAITTSAGYGAGITIPGSGLWLNNSLGEVELFPAGMDGFTPGTRLPSNMAPTVARRDDGAVIAIGTPGASRITTALAQVLVNFVHLDMSLKDAVAHPRVHIEVFEGEPTIAHEPGLGIPPLSGLRRRGFPDLSMYFGGVGVAMFDPDAGLFHAADPRRSGGVAVGGR